LGENLKAAGKAKPENHAAHHIVAADSPKAIQARKILEKYGIDINAAENGVWLPTGDKIGRGTNHLSLHTNRYYNEVNRRLMQAKSKKEVLEILQDIEKELANNTFPH
jgi:hypothetical protein